MIAWRKGVLGVSHKIVILLIGDNKQKLFIPFLAKRPRTLGARSRGSKNVTYIQQTTDKKVNTEEKSQKYGVIL